MNIGLQIEEAMANLRAAQWDADYYGEWVGASTTLRRIPSSVYDRLLRWHDRLRELREIAQWEYL